MTTPQRARSDHPPALLVVTKRATHGAAGTFWERRDQPIQPCELSAKIRQFVMAITAERVIACHICLVRQGEKLMSKHQTTAHDTGATSLSRDSRELRDDELDAVTGGLVVNNIIAILIADISVFYSRH